MTKFHFVFIFFIFLSFRGEAQLKQTTSETQLWTAYLNQTRFTNRFGVWVDVHLRTKQDLVKDLSQGIARAGLTYYISDAVRATAGYAFINAFPADGHKHISQPEHRPWQQIQWLTKYKKLRTAQTLRLEERFRRKVLNDSTLGVGHSFNYRLRYNFLLQVPLTSKEVLTNEFSFILNNEVHINFGKQIVFNYFDQNRFFAGFAYHPNAHDNIQFGYSNVFQQLGSGNKYRSLHLARIFYFHNLDLRSRR